MVTFNTDVLVVGSGSAGMAAAIAARARGHSVLVVEKDEYLGGTSAISGGWLWVPGNAPGIADGDTRADAEAYIRALAGESYDAAAVATFLDTVPEAMDFFERRTDVEFVYPEAAPDYRMEAPGARRGGRAVTVRRADARILGEDRLRLRPYLYSFTVFGYMPEIGKELSTFLDVNRSVRATGYVARALLRTWYETLRHGRAFTRTNGNALMTGLVATARRMGIPMWTSSPVTELLTDADGAVTGARVGGSKPGVIEARLGVVLAAGGFGGNPAVRRRVFAHDRAEDDHVTPTVGQDGDSYRLGTAAGADFTTRPHQPASWAPVTHFRTLRGKRRVFPHLRAFGLPGLIAVNRHGKRFANESLSYHDFGTALIADNADENGTYGYIIADRKAMRRYGIGYAKPWPLPTWYYRRVGYLTAAPTVAELAGKIGLPAQALQTTLDEFNADAERGVDSRFARGSTWFHHFKGDPKHTPNPNLAPLDTGPYYAVRIGVGDLGTYAGLSVDADGRVLDAAGATIRGLHAVGTAAVSVFGGAYPGYGANIGPGMVLGYLVGRDIASGTGASGDTSVAGTSVIDTSTDTESPAAVMSITEAARRSRAS